MKKLEKILVIGTLALGGSLLGFGFYLHSPLMKRAGVLASLMYPAGIAIRALIEKDDREYYKKFNRISGRQNS